MRGPRCRRRDRELPAGGIPGSRPQAPARRLTCLKQKGMVRTLTPTMLFTMFMISPQLEAAAAVIARALGPGSPGVRRRDHRGARGPDRRGRLPGGGGLAGRRRGRQPADAARPRGRPMAASLAHSLPPAASAPPRQTRKRRQLPTRHSSARLRGCPRAHTSAFRRPRLPEVTTRSEPKKSRMGGAFKGGTRELGANEGQALSRGRVWRRGQAAAELSTFAGAALASRGARPLNPPARGCGSGDSPAEPRSGRKAEGKRKWPRRASRGKAGFQAFS